MISIVGIVLTFLMVFGGYLLAGGKLGIILKSLPFEMMMIGGAAAGSFALANSASSVKHTLMDIKKVFVGAKWRSADYLSLFSLLYTLLQTHKKNPIELDEHIDDPKSSDIFNQFPKLLGDSAAVDLVCDTIRTTSMNYSDPMQIEDILDKKIDEQKHHQEASVHGLQSVADGLPALGIVAAVLGVIKTMGSIDQPPEVLGKLIGGALVGTFLGVFLAYCLVAPIAAKVKATSDEDLNFYKAIKEVLVAYLRGHPPKTCLEVARQAVPHPVRPGFEEVEETLRKPAAGA